MELQLVAEEGWWDSRSSLAFYHLLEAVTVLSQISEKQLIAATILFSIIANISLTTSSSYNEEIEDNSSWRWSGFAHSLIRMLSKN